MKITTAGLDLAKTVFQVHGVDERGKAILRKTLKRKEVLAFFATLPPCVIGMEACAGSHYWARELMKLGHTAKLIAPQFVKPYVKGNKNDANDAEAICEAVGRPFMRFVPVKSVEQQDIQALPRVRSGLVKERTAKVNQVRGLLSEYGLVMGQGVSQVRRRLPEILEEAENGLSVAARALFAELWEQVKALDEQVAAYPAKIEKRCQASTACRKLMKIPGIGPLTATALVAAIADGSAFQTARQVASSLGLTPRQESSGGKAKLLGISKWGDSYLRTFRDGCRSCTLENELRNASTFSTSRRWFLCSAKFTEKSTSRPDCKGGGSRSWRIPKSSAVVDANDAMRAGRGGRLEQRHV